MKRDEDSESASLVGRENPGSYTEDARPSPAIRETDYVDTDVPLLSQFHEDAIAQAGEGLFQWLVFLVCGLALAADSIEIMVIAYVLPSAERELCMDDARKGWLGGVSFIGMMIGGLLWGNLADKMGRRRTLLSALLTNALFSVITTFMPTYGLFTVTRLCSGIGVGGSIPIVFTYYAEFLLKKHRGRNLCWLLLFWAIGGVFTSVMAWGLIPRTGATLLGLGRLHFSSWRVFLLVCSFPAVVSVLGLAFLPESPRFLLEMGRDVEAMCVYQQIFKMNHSNKPGVEYQLSELELPGRRAFHGIPPAVNRSMMSDLCFSLESFWGSFFQMICSPFTKVTLVLLVIWLTTSFGFYGVGIWFPEYLRKIQADSYSADATIEANHFIRDYVFNYSLDNTNFEGCVFHNVRFTGIVLNHVLFTNCSFINSTFSDVRSSRSFFEHCDFPARALRGHGLLRLPLPRLRLHNSTTFLNRRTGCPIDFDVNFRLSDVFVENLFAQLAISSGKHHLLLHHRQDWSRTHLRYETGRSLGYRSTAYGFLSAASRLAALLGSLTFGHFISMSRSVPIVTTAAVLLVGCLASLRLPETRDVLM
ncbi:hypothetical protein HPB51_011742 [Rhipicephalus microplus]|uniref:Major facilitator superfamily (MFS) profile domain-containing protein n=1 Tax=Rhipicephalus microplus TaxID=6941 RepID=A0A9J6DMT0_RHIMP|nr:hypothetical protein HPB51_011742 [Rhipicephalus microplus]